MSQNADRKYQDSLFPFVDKLVDLGAAILRWRKIWSDDLDIRTGTVTETPLDPTDIVNKDYVDDAIAGVSLTVEGADGSPSYSPVTTLQFDEADGFVITNPGPAEVRIDLSGIPITSGGTGAATAAGARTNLDVPSNAEAILDTIIDAKGDLIVGTAADTPSRVAVGGTNGMPLLVASGQASGVQWAYPTAPTTQTFLSGTAATYTTPAGARYIEIEVVGGGGGGAGGNTDGTAGTAGTASTFSGGALSAGGGGAGQINGQSPDAGAATGGNVVNLLGANGCSPATAGTVSNMTGGAGANSVFGGGGAPSSPGTAAGGAGRANTGGGGAGGSINTTTQGGGGGGAGSYVKHRITSPAATYTYTVGGGGAGGAAGTSAGAGGAGAAGIIIVHEYYI